MKRCLLREICTLIRNKFCITSWWRIIWFWSHCFRSFRY